MNEPRIRVAALIRRGDSVLLCNHTKHGRSYWLLPKGDEEGPVRAYHLLVDAMSGGERVALGTLVIHSREHPVAIRTREGRLLLSTMLFSHEIRPFGDLDIPTLKAPHEAVARSSERRVGIPEFCVGPGSRRPDERSPERA